MIYEALAITHLHRSWEELVEEGHLTREELYDSLHTQADGSMDMSADELDDVMCRLMGWNPSDITEDQYRIWKTIVDKAADEFIRQ